MADQRIEAAQVPRRYIDLPKTTTFVESACHNRVFRPRSVFVPVTATGDDSGLYEVDLDSDAVTKRCSLPPDGQYFGSKLDDGGFCYILFVGNDPTTQTGKVYGVDLELDVPEFFLVTELPKPFQPNDVAFDLWSDRLYIAAYAQRYNLMSTRGQVLQSLRNMATEDSARVFVCAATAGATCAEFAKGFRALAGAVVVPRDKALWVSELTSLARVPLDDPNNWTRVEPFNPALLADNMEVQGDEVVFPFYRVATTSEGVEKILPALLDVADNKTLMKGVYKTARCYYWCCGAGGKGIEPAGDEEDAAPPAGPTEGVDRFEDACWGRYNVKTGEYKQVRVDIHADKFDGHCTHLEVRNGRLRTNNYSTNIPPFFGFYFFVSCVYDEKICLVITYDKTALEDAPVRRWLVRITCS